MTVPRMLANCQAQPGATDVEIAALERDIECRLPADYKALLRECNGVEGFLVPGAYLILWSTAQIRESHEGYEVRDFLPGIVLLGSNGGGTAYGVSSEETGTRYVSVPFIGMCSDEITVIGTTLDEFLARVAR